MIRKIDERAGFPRSAPPAGLCGTATTWGPRPSAAVLAEPVQPSGSAAPLQDSQAPRGAPRPATDPTSFPLGPQLLPEAGAPAPVQATPVFRGH